KRRPWRGRLHLGWAELEVEPDESTEEMACRAIDVLEEELGIYLPRFETGRIYTNEETARVRASLPKPEEPNPPFDPAQPQPNNEAAERRDPATDDAADRPAFPEPDCNQFEIFIEGAFRYCDLTGVVSLRSFYQSDTGRAFNIQTVSLKNGLKPLIEAAVNE